MHPVWENASRYRFGLDFFLLSNGLGNSGFVHLLQTSSIHSLGDCALLLSSLFEEFREAVDFETVSDIIER